MESNKFRVPRKQKKLIPNGVYCYKGLRYDLETGVYYIKLCPFFTHIKCKEKPEELQNEIDKEFPEETIGWCKLIKGDIDDQCKSCGIKHYFKGVKR
jgi:hypothetical protein